MEHTFDFDIPRTFKFTFASFAFVQDLDPQIFKKFGRTDLNAMRHLAMAGLLHEKKFMQSEVDMMFDRFMEKGGKLPAFEKFIIETINDSTFVASMTPDKKEEVEEPKN